MAAATQYRKFAPSDWHLSNFTIASSAERQRSIAHDVRQQSQRLRNETESKTQWTQHSTDTNLQSRIGDIHNWKDTLEKTLADTETEIDKLSEHKDRTEQALEAKTLPLAVVIECLGLREQRVAIDRVRDEVESELHKELEVIEGIQSVLHQKVNEAFEQICVLQECHQQLHSDLTDKHMALQIDTECEEMKNTSDTITMQVDPTRIKKGIVTPAQWESFSTHNTARAESEMRSSTHLREATNQSIQQTTTDLEAQWTATAYAFRRRLHEMEQARQELLWQQKNTEEEIAQVQAEIRGLEQSLAEKTPPMMVAQTRLENRTYRPNVELCRDQPQYGMVTEVAEIAQSQQKLREKLAVAEYALGSLQRTLERIMQDLAVKENSLAIDQQCMRLREKLTQHPKAHELAQPRPAKKE